MGFLKRTQTDELFRREQFPCLQNDRIFLAHAAVTAVPKLVTDTMNEFNRAASTGEVDYTDLLINQMDAARETCTKIIHAKPNEIALLGPTSLGLSLVANGLNFKEGDEIICYLDDYPANVYPWKNLEKLHGTKTIFLKPEEPGTITPELVEAALTERTRLVALASCHFLTGYRIDFDAIGQLIHEKSEALFCLDAIQTVGAFPTTVEHVDFLSADSHKWMLGPMTAGIFYVAEEHFDKLRPSLLGAWNVQSPNFIAQDAVDFESGCRRYEPGVLNAQGILGMDAAIRLLDQEIGIDVVSKRLLEVKTHFVNELTERGFEIANVTEGPNASAITAFTSSDPLKLTELYQNLLNRDVVASFRHDRENIPFVRFSPHFYNHEEDAARVFEIIDSIA